MTSITMNFHISEVRYSNELEIVVRIPDDIIEDITPEFQAILRK